MSCQGKGICACRDPQPEPEVSPWQTIKDGLEKQAAERHPSSQAFVDRINAYIDLHDRKQRDYGSDTDPFANIREGARQLGLPAWIGAVVRMNDKMRRLNTAAKQYIETGEINLANEGVIDSFDDLGVYSGIGACLFEEEN